MNKAFCYECREDTKYKIKYQKVTVKFKDKDVKYLEKNAIRKKCGKYVYVWGFNDRNLKVLYRKAGVKPHE
jgi:hypothetical protein